MPQEKAGCMKLENIEFLMKGHGDITLGRIGPIRCAATAASDGNTLAMLVRRPRESFTDFLFRLDKAIGTAMEQETIIDEING
jgi:hypothetical protein